MSVFLSPVGGAGAQFFDGNGNPLSGGKLYTYEAGTTTPQVTYTSSAGTILHANPIILDAAGRVPGSSEIWLVDNAVYKFVLKDGNDVLQAAWDQIAGLGSINRITYRSTGTGSQTVFSTGGTLTATSITDIYINGVYQNKDTYVVGTGSITFSEAPPVNSVIELLYIS